MSDEVRYSTIFEDEHILVIDKPPLLAVQSEQKEESLETILQKTYQSFSIVHRLDQRVGGLMIVAKSELATNQLNDDFQNGFIKKKYKAIISGKPYKNADTLTHWIMKSASNYKVKTFTEERIGSKRARLRYELISSSEKYSLLEIDLLTGRFHQIRAQLAAIACPIVGDLKYGFPRSTPDGSIFLQSNQLSFRHPVTKEDLNFEIETPILWKKYGF